MKTFKITNTFTNTTTTEEHENIQQAWRSIEKTIALQAVEDIDNNGLEENWRDYYQTEYHAHAAHALNFLYFRRQEYEIVELKEPTNLLITGDISTMIYNLEQMDFTAEEILMRLEDCLKEYEFELDTENGDAITLKDDSLDKETTLLNKRDDLVFELATVACELDNIEVDFSDMEQSQMFIDVTDYVTDYLEEIAKEQKGN